MNRGELTIIVCWVNVSFFGHLGKACAAITTAVTETEVLTEGNKKIAQPKRGISATTKTKQKKTTIWKHLPNTQSYWAPALTAATEQQACMFISTAGSLEGLPLNNHRKTSRKSTEGKNNTLTLAQSLTSADLSLSLTLFFASPTLLNTEKNGHFTVSSLKQESPLKLCSTQALKQPQQATRSSCSPAWICSNRPDHWGIVQGRKWHRQVLPPSFYTHVNNPRLPAVKLYGFWKGFLNDAREQIYLN